MYLKFREVLGGDTFSKGISSMEVLPRDQTPLLGFRTLLGKKHVGSVFRLNRVLLRDRDK